MTLFFDTETTGLPQKRWVSALAGSNNWPDIVSIAWQLDDDESSDTKKEYHIIRPEGWTIPAESVKFHGITQEHAMAEGESLASVMTLFKEDVDKATMIVAHNMEFDRNVVYNAWKWRLGLDFHFSGQQFCTQERGKWEMKLPGNPRYAMSTDPYKLPKLDELYENTYGYPPIGGAHNAERDVDVLQAIFWRRWSR